MPRRRKLSHAAIRRLGVAALARLQILSKSWSKIMSDYELSTELFALRRKLAEHNSGLVMTGDDIIQLTSKLKTMGIIAQRNEHDLRRLRSFENVVAARRIGPSEATVLAAASAPDSNIHLLTVERPFSDGAPV